jgi:sugar-specific transcriptional regulator TrmB
MDLVHAMSRFGFTKYESQAYAALLKLGPVTGYELGKGSGVPLSKSYVTLQRLVDKGAAIVEQTDPPRYAPVAPETLAASCRANIAADLDALLQAAVALPVQRDSLQIWCVAGRTNVLNMAGELIRESQRSVRLEAGPVDLQLLRPALGEVRGEARVHLVRSAAEATRTAKAGVILLLSDDRRVLAGTTEPADGCRAICTRNKGVIRLAFGYLKNLEVPVASSESPIPRRGVHEDWLAWEDRKHRDLVGRLN